VTLYLDFKVTVRVIIDALVVLYVELTRDLFAIAKFLMRHRQRKRLMTSKVPQGHRQYHPSWDRQDFQSETGK